MAQRLSAAGAKAPILARLDSGFDSTHLMREIEAYNRPGLAKVDWLIKWNPRTTNVAALLQRLDADTATRWEYPRAGKRVTLWEEVLHIEGIDRPLRRVLRLIERTIDAKGQLLIEPRAHAGGLEYEPGRPTVRCQGCHRVVCRSRHARAVPLRVQDRPRSGAAALGQV